MPDPYRTPNDLLKLPPADLVLDVEMMLSEMYDTREVSNQMLDLLDMPVPKREQELRDIQREYTTYYINKQNLHDANRVKGQQDR